MPVVYAHWYEEYLATDHWQRVRERALERADYRCVVCNSTRNLNVHHRSYDRLGDESDTDVTVLCRECHKTFHDRRFISKDREEGEYIVELIWARGSLNGVERTPISLGMNIIFVITHPHIHIIDNLLVCTVDRVIHDNGVAWGGSHYRKYIEAFLGRTLRKAETTTIRDVVGRRGIIRVTYFSDGYHVTPVLEESIG